jgi:hypothetical protein
MVERGRRALSLNVHAKSRYGLPRRWGLRLSQIFSQALKGDPKFDSFLNESKSSRT